MSIEAFHLLHVYIIEFEYVWSQRQYGVSHCRLVRQYAHTIGSNFFEHPAIQLLHVKDGLPLCHLDKDS